MKKMREIQTASERWHEPLEPENFQKDRLIADLEAQGHIAITVDRGVVVVEQCELDDEFPKGWSSDPLKVSVYSDPDLSGTDEATQLFIHVGRYGLTGILLQHPKDQKLYQLVQVEATGSELVFTFASDIAKIEALLYLAQKNLTGFYSESEEKSVRFKRDETLERLGSEAQAAIQSYLDYLRQLPDVWSGNWDDLRQ